MSYMPPRMIAPFWGWTDFTPALPEFYWDVYSAEERIKKLCMELHKLCDYANMLGENINLDHKTIEQLEADFEKFKESGFVDYYIEQIQNWLDNNMERLICRAMKMVFFGLTQDGYFVAYIPDSWSDIGFDTGAVYNLPTYGRLILTYEAGFADSLHDGDVDSQLGTIDGRLDRIETTLYTPIGEGGE